MCLHIVKSLWPMGRTGNGQLQLHIAKNLQCFAFWKFTFDLYLSDYCLGEVL